MDSKDKLASKLFDEKLKEILFETFQFTIDFLNKHHLRWFACGGTMLGAVRHQDIIPWDDDIDVMMPREDYEKLLSLKTEFYSSNYELVSIHDKGYYLTSAKVFDKRTTIWEVRRYEYLVGVFVDIFPLDRIDLSMEEYKQQYSVYARTRESYQLSLSKFTFSEFIWDLKKRHPNALRSGIKSLFYPSKRSEFCFLELLKVERMFCNNVGRFTISPSGAYGTREFFLTEWFEGALIMPFGHLMVNVPIGFHDYLTVMYGDYLKLPPESQRVSHHGQYYVNLSEALPKEEVKTRIKKNKYYEV